MTIAKLNDVGEEIFLSRYAYPGEKTWGERAKVIARVIATAEKDEDKKITEEKFYKAISSGDFIPGGRIIYGAGRNSGHHNLLNCFHRNTRVYTENGWKYIKDIKIGDKVLTHKGRFRKVSNKFNQGKREKLLYLKIRSLNRDLVLKVTEDHKILTPLGYVRADKLKEGDNVLTGFIDSSEFKSPQKICIFDYVTEHVYSVVGEKIGKSNKLAGEYNWSTNKTIPELRGNPLINEINFNEDFALWSGYYLAEGCSGKHKYTTTFTFNSNETNYVKEVLLLGKKIFGVEGKEDYSKAGNWVQVIFNSIIMNEFHRKYFGTYSKTKKIPIDFYGSNDFIKRKLLSGMIRGDGSMLEGPRSSSYTITFGNTNLAYQVYLLSKSLGYDCTYTIDTKKKKESYSDLGKTLIRPVKFDYNLVNEVEGWPVKEIVSLDYIKSILIEEYDDYVWDISVEEDHSLVADGIICSNCFAIIPEDSVESIGKTIKDVYKISCAGGGVGLNFSNIRPKGDDIGNVLNSAPGSISVIKMINEIGNHVRAGKARRTALMGILNVTHPDLLEFLEVKLNKKELNNFNISVAITDRFIEACELGEEWYFTFNNKKYYRYRLARQTNGVYADENIFVLGLNEEDAIKRAEQHYKIDFEDKFEGLALEPIKAKEIWNIIWKNSVESGDPGIYHIDNANRFTNVSYFERLDTTNPCGEISLPSYGNCCLGNINLSNMIVDKDVDWKKLARTIRIGIRFLDNVLSVNSFPTRECKEVGEKSRRIGLGVTGLHYMLIKLGLRYGSEKCLEYIERLFATIRDEAYKASVYLARDKGAFPAFEYKKYLNEEFAKTLPARIRMLIKEYGIRNAVMLTIPPCGTISMVHGISSGIEPIFSAMYKRRYRSENVWKEIVFIDPLFKECYLKHHVKNANKDYILYDYLFVGAYDVTSKEHLQVQIAIQKYIDSCISKTINLPEDVEADELSTIALDFVQYLKGLTVYRAGSKGNEPLEEIPLIKENIEKYIKDDDVVYYVESTEKCSLVGGACGE